jgi:RecA-family ATPase
MPGVDFRGDGGYVLLPDSRHASGATYRWADGTEHLDPAPMPDWLAELEREATTHGETRPPLDLGPILEGVPEGQRDDTLYRFACKLRGDDVPATYAELLVRQAARLCRPAFDEGVAADKVARAYRDFKPTPQLRIAPAGTNGTAKGIKGAHANGAIPFGADDPLRAVGHVKRLSDVQPEPVRWLWPGRIPLGKVTADDGDPGLGKSTTMLDLAARASRGLPMPDGSRGDLSGPAGAVILSAEDGLADTIRPRLDAAGADAARVVALTHVTDAGGDRLPTLADIAVLRAAVEQAEAKLVIIDPFMAYLPGEVNSYRDQDVRRVLARLGQLAEETGAAIVIIRHLTKGGAANPLYRGGGSIGIIGAARSALLVAKDPDDPDGPRRILAIAKGNLAAPVPSLAYRLQAAENGSVRVVWEGETAHTAASLLAAANETPEDRDAGSDAAGFLREALREGERPAEDVLREARKAGVAEATLKRAKKRVGVLVRKEGFGSAGRWLWSLGAADAAAKGIKEGLSGSSREMGALVPIDPLSDPGGMCPVHRRWLSWHEQQAGICFTCAPGARPGDRGAPIAEDHGALPF